MQPQKNAEPTFSLEMSRRFDASPERVFDAWLSPEWAEWLPPAGAHCKVAALEPRMGGRYLVNMTMSDGRTVEISGQYREVVRPRKLVFTWFANYSNQETLITVTFKSDGAGTLMNFRQEGFPAIEQRDGYQNGWSGSGGAFDKLAARVAADVAAHVAAGVAGGS